MTTNTAPFGKSTFDNSIGLRAMPVLAHWDITYACNFRCSFCLTSSGVKKTAECSTSEAKALIDQLYGAGILFLRFLGGEPFFRRDMIELLEYAANKGMLLSFSTNGSLITQKIAMSLFKIVESLRYVQVSLHGADEETYAQVTRGHGNFSRAMRGLQLLVENGLEVSVLVVVTGENVDRIKDYYEVAKQYGAKEVRLAPIAPIGRALSDEYATTAKSKLWEGLVIQAERIMEGSYSGRPRLLVQARPLLGNYLKKLANLDTFHSDCIAGTAMLFLDPSGRIAPCPFLQQMSSSLSEEHQCFQIQEPRGRHIQEVWNSANFQKFQEYHDPAKNPSKIEVNCKYYKDGSCLPCVLTPCNCMELIASLHRSSMQVINKAS